ncbi:ParB/RepB/Spo0J family partition protein [Pararhizobium sp. YC-54]|uniref:ParB/RepB/Spo0J family partition protein n=1 Tax=Pararhizobium sp. YC-54 TaxID=2986920 RepID=UPI0021F6BE60|nr:ParB/RepB/Spo0J family partition protein [Pararhizobium sp. YC-54]MCW0001556.1 ParB/RepB/Spo0J family partition protein [Pararhizobium sp. YC-54]
MTDTNPVIETFFVALNKLDADPKNVRKTYSKTGIEELAATIRADGYRLLQNIIVRKGDKRGRFFVTAGGRRLAALLQLAEAGEIAKDYPVECKERSGGDATEISLIENSAREAMLPIEEYEAYRALAEEGKSVEEIAARFGTSETFIRRRLALARVSPVLLELFRNEEMSFQQLSAFTVSDDHEKQVEVWNSLPTWNRDSRSIKSALQAEAIKANDKRIRFIGGIEVYEAAGGAVKRDLFDEGNGGYALDVALVEKLVAARLEEEAEKLRAEGWNWVECVSVFLIEAHAMPRVYPEAVALTDEQQGEKERLETKYSELAELIEAGVADDDAETRVEAIQTELAALAEAEEAYDPADIAKAGCYVLIDYYGDLSVERGFVRPEQIADDQGEGALLDSTGEGGTGPTEKQPEPSFTLSAALTQELTAQKTAAIRAELAHSPDIALAAVVHAMLASLFNPYGSGEETCLEIKLTSENLETSIRNPAACKGIAAMDDLKENYGHIVPGNPRDLWDWCLEQPTATLLDLLAYAAARSVNALQLGHYERKKQRAHADRIAEALKIDMSQWFEPTAENYFGRISKTGIEQAITEAKGAEFVAGVSGMKKADAAAYAERQTAGTGWLPGPVCIAPIVGEGREQIEDIGDLDVDDQADVVSDEFSEAAE